MPVLGVTFLRHATNRYYAAKREIEAEQAAGRMPKRPLIKADFLKRRQSLDTFLLLTGSIIDILTIDHHAET